MLSIALPILGGLATVVGLWQAVVRWRAFGTDLLRELVKEARTTFYDITARGSLDRSEFQTEERRTLEERLQDLRDQLHDDDLQGRVDHLMQHVRTVWAAAPEKQFGVRYLDSPDRLTTESPERRALIERQVEAARDGLVEVESVLQRCNQLNRLIVWS